MSALAFVLLSAGAFVVLVGVFGVLPVLLSLSTARSRAGHRSRRLRIMQSNIALLTVLAVVATCSGMAELLARHGDRPLLLGMVAAGAVIAPTSVITYVRLDRQTSRTD